MSVYFFTTPRLLKRLGLRIGVYFLPHPLRLRAKARLGSPGLFVYLLPQLYTLDHNYYANSIL